MKHCYACGRDLPEVAFWHNRAKKDGLSSECRECKKIKDAESHVRNRDARIAGMKKYRAEHLEGCREKERRYARSPRGRNVNQGAVHRYAQTHREQISSKTKRANKKYPEKYVSRYTFGNAIKLGKVQRSKTCSLCGTQEGVMHGHHPDYGKPMEILWLCVKCHGLQHRKEVSDD